jgi:CubicO group peptidase (beta-lactamase class C family)
MRDTGFFVSSSDRPRLAECYVRRADDPLGLPGSSFEGDRTHKPTFLSGGGGLISTVRDYVCFCDFLLRRGRSGGAQLLSPGTLDLMSTNHLPRGLCLPEASRGLFSDGAYAGIGFGLGWATTVDKQQSRMPGNPGDILWSGMANTFFWCDPREDLCCVFMTQLLPSETYPLQREIKTRVYDALPVIA